MLFVLAERWFCADSVAVRDMCAMLEDHDVRWRLSMRGIDRLLDDRPRSRGSPPGDVTIRDEFTREHRVDKDVPFQKALALGERYRKERLALDALLDAPRTRRASSHPRSRNSRSARRRAHRSLPSCATPRRAGRSPRRSPTSQRATSTCTSTASCAPPRAHELVLYDRLARLYEARIARRRNASARRFFGHSARSTARYTSLVAADGSTPRSSRSRALHFA